MAKRSRQIEKRRAREVLAARQPVIYAGGGIIKSGGHDELLRLVPDDRLLVESDAPYLAPVPHRGKRNEPAWVGFTVATDASIKNGELEVAGNDLSTLIGRPTTPLVDTLRANA